MNLKGQGIGPEVFASQKMSVFGLGHPLCLCHRYKIRIIKNCGRKQSQDAALCTPRLLRDALTGSEYEDSVMSDLQTVLLLLLRRSDESCSLLMALPRSVRCFRGPMPSS